jgi:hypothetical protein
MSTDKKSKRYMAVFEFQKTSMPNAPGKLLNFRKGAFVYRYDKKTVDNQEWFFGRDDRQTEGWFPAALVQRSRPTRASISQIQTENSLSSIDLKSPSPQLQKTKSSKKIESEEVFNVIKVVRGSQVTNFDFPHFFFFKKKLNILSSLSLRIMWPLREKGCRF